MDPSGCAFSVDDPPSLAIVVAIARVGSRVSRVGRAPVGTDADRGRGGRGEGEGRHHFVERDGCE